MARKAAAEHAAWEAAQVREEAAWQDYASIRTGANLEAVTEALKVYSDRVRATDEARTAYVAAYEAPTPS